MNYAKNNDKIKDVMFKEAQLLVDAWMDEEFPGKLAMYTMKLMEARQKAK
jgi:hypothetical protein